MHERTVTFTSGGTALAGSLVTPDGPGPYPAALLIPGSGELDRDANHKRIKLNLSRDLAQILADVGWATFRYDKRGVGESEGDYMSTGFFEELSDVLAAYKWLDEQPDVTLTAAVGHSAGALHAAEIARRQPGLAGAVLLATSAKTGEETLSWQTRQIQEHAVPAIAKALLRLFRTSVVRQQAKAVNRIKETTADTARIQMVKVNAKWMREYMAYDPVPALREAQAPLLAVTGSKDIQVDPDDLRVVVEVAPTGIAAELIENVDHLLRHEPASFSNPRKYKNQTTKPIDGRVETALVTWLHDIVPAAPTASELEAPK